MGPKAQLRAGQGLIGSKHSSLAIGLAQKEHDLVAVSKRKRESNGFMAMKGVGDLSPGGGARYWKKKAQSSPSPIERVEASTQRQMVELTEGKEKEGEHGSNTMG